MSFKIYTKTGDTGNTSLIGGTRTSKANIRIEAYGTIDELNSYLGLVSDTLDIEPQEFIIKSIQDRLFTIGSSLATDPTKDSKMLLPDLKEADIAFLESEIDRLDLELPLLKNFVIPGGCKAASTCHIARCICRRAERIVITMQIENEFVAPLVIKYLNRLSDFLFVYARYISNKKGVAEIVWHPRI